MSVTVEDFLEHHGVKGQHWGIRNLKQDVHNLKTKINKNKKLKVGLEIGGGVAATAAIATGAIIADRLIRKHSAMKATDLTKLWSKGHVRVPNFSPTVMKTPMSALPKSAGKGSFISTLTGAKKVENRLNKTLKPGSSVTTADVNRAVSNIGKATYQTAKTTKRKDLLKALGSVRIGVG
jgi:hypothetical protein